MGILKDEALKMGLTVKKSSFRVVFSVQEWQFQSEPFKIVSSFGQLPKDLQSKRSGRALEPKLV